ncbi:MAG: hypothetical protein WKF84_20930 [Pyrinomonadaceae bacterium]
MNATVEKMNAVSVSPVKRLRGEMRVPGDKSVSHRAAMLASLAEGRSTLTNFSSAADCQATLNCMAALGARIDRSESTVTIEGTGRLTQASSMLDAVNSGTTMRLPQASLRRSLLKPCSRATRVCARGLCGGWPRRSD